MIKIPVEIQLTAVALTYSYSKSYCHWLHLIAGGKAAQLACIALDEAVIQRHGRWVCYDMRISVLTLDMFLTLLPMRKCFVAKQALVDRITAVRQHSTQALVFGFGKGCLDLIVVHLAQFLELVDRAAYDIFRATGHHVDPAFVPSEKLTAKQAAKDS